MFVLYKQLPSTYHICMLLLDLVLSPFIMGILSQSMPLNIGLIVWPTESLHEQIMAARMSFLAEKRPGDV